MSKSNGKRSFVDVVTGRNKGNEDTTGGRHFFSAARRAAAEGNSHLSYKMDERSAEEIASAMAKETGNGTASKHKGGSKNERGRPANVRTVLPPTLLHVAQNSDS